jgi:regulatory protein YycH of two-component signal transduction system YycFG
MNFEGAKNIILTILVVISAILTWNIWTYQPEYEKIDQSNDFIPVASDQRDISEVVKPMSILIHRDGKYYLVDDEQSVSKIQKIVSKWSFFGFKDISHQIDSKKFKSFVYAEGSTEIKFAESIPLDLYKSVLNIQDKDVPKFSFDRIIFKTDVSGNEANVHFVNFEKKKVYQCTISGSQLTSFKNQFYKKAYKFPEYFAADLNTDYPIFLPKNPVKLNSYKYIADYLEIRKFKDGLFNNPDQVKRETVPVGDQFMDGSRVMTVYKEPSTIRFINPAQKGKIAAVRTNLLQKSIDFVNNHAGWEDNYRYSELSEAEQRVVFRLYIDGHPVFDDAGMSELSQVWGDEDIYSYQRPYFALSFPMPADTKETTLPSGQEILQKIGNINNFKEKDLEDLTVGYQITRDSSQPKIIILEPSWYYRYGGSWLVFPLANLGGGQSGLE